MKTSKINFIISLILSTSMLFSCVHSDKTDIKIYLPVSENYSNEFGDLFLYVENDSTFCYCYSVSTSDVVNYAYLTHGRIERVGNLSIFYDELGRRIFTTTKRHKELLINSGLFKGSKLIEVDTVDFIEDAKYVLQQIVQDEHFDYSQKVMNYFTEKNLINDNFNFYSDSSINIHLSLDNNGSFNMYFDSSLLLRSGRYVNNKGIYTFYDTIIPTVEKAVAVFDSSIFSFNLGFTNSEFIKIGNYTDLRRADTMKYMLGLIEEYPRHHTMDPRLFNLKKE